MKGGGAVFDEDMVLDVVDMLEDDTVAVEDETVAVEDDIVVVKDDIVVVEDDVVTEKLADVVDVLDTEPDELVKLVEVESVVDSVEPPPENVAE